ncbi:hypothetical protein B0H13DRAFT_1995364, partial [Mycena leptocephala]
MHASLQVHPNGAAPCAITTGHTPASSSSVIRVCYARCVSRTPHWLQTCLALGRSRLGHPRAPSTLAWLALCRVVVVSRTEHTLDFAAHSLRLIGGTAAPRRTTNERLLWHPPKRMSRNNTVCCSAHHLRAHKSLPLTASWLVPSVHTPHSTNVTFATRASLRHLIRTRAGAAARRTTKVRRPPHVIRASCVIMSSASKSWRVAPHSSPSARAQERLQVAHHAYSTDARRPAHPPRVVRIRVAAAHHVVVHAEHKAHPCSY